MKAHRGFTLIELMIGILIGLIVTLAAMTILADSEQRRRTQSSVTGIDQSSQFLAYSLDQTIRSAGSGYAQSWAYTFGCRLTAQYNGATLFPLAAPPAPFANALTLMGGTYRLAPVVILKTVPVSAAAPDILMIASGAAGYGEIAESFSNQASAAALNLIGTAGLQANDVMLVGDQNSGGSVSDCVLEQAASTFVSGPSVTQVPLAGTYYTNSSTLTNFSINGLAEALGNNNPTSPNLPNISLYGVGGNNLTAATPSGYSLYSYNLLKPLDPTNNPPVAITDGVIDFRALYYVDANSDGKGYDGLPDAWIDPGTNASYQPSVLLNGTATSAMLLERIKAIRIGMIVRTSLVEKIDATTNQPASGTSTLTMFADTADSCPSCVYTRTLAASPSNDQNYRYRVVETTIPLRNMLLIAQ